MIALQYTNFAVFLLSFLVSAFTHNWAIGLVVNLVLLQAVFWPSDFYNVTPDIQVWYHVWTTGIALAAGVAGHLYAKAMKCPQLITFSTLRSLRDDVYIPAEDLFVFLFVMSPILIAAGINFWLRRTLIGGGGLSPINVDLVTPGIGMTIAFSIVLIIASIGLAATNYDGRVTLKYGWIVILPPLSIIANDLGYYNGGWSEPWPQLLSIFVMVILILIGWIIAYKAPLARLGTPSETDTSQPSDVDPFYDDWEYSQAFFCGIITITVIGAIVLCAITGWFVDRSLYTGGITMIAYCGVVIVADLIIGYAVPDVIAKLRKKRFVEDTRKVAHQAAGIMSLERWKNNK